MPTLEPPDATLLAAASGGDREARSQLIREIAPMVLGWCLHLAYGRVDPEDAAHDVLVSVLDHLGSVRDPEAFPAWVWRITSREVVRQARAARLRAWLPLPDTWKGRPDRDPWDGGDDLARDVQAAVDALPRRLREVIVLCDLCCYTDDEAAALLLVPLGTVKSRLQRARVLFRREAEGRGLAPVRALAP